MLGAVWPSCGSVYGCLSNRPPQEKVHRDNISLGRDQAECRILLASSSLHALFVLITFMILLVVNSFTLSVTHGMDIIIPGNLFFFLFAEILCCFLSGNNSCYSIPWELFCFSADRIRGNKS